MTSFWDWFRQRRPPKDTHSLLSTDLQQNRSHLENRFQNTPDLMIRSFEMMDNKEVLLVNIKGLVNKEIVNEQILRYLMLEAQSIDELNPLQSKIPVGQLEVVLTWDEIEKGILTGKTILFVAGYDHAFVFHTQGWIERSPEEPESETFVKGSHQGFIESIDTNLALVRRYLPNRELKLKQYRVGVRSDTKVYVAYLEDVTNPKYLEYLDKKLRDIEIDALMTGGELANLIEDHSRSIFPQLRITERPDTTAASILQGRVAVMIDRSSSVVVGPVTFWSFIKSEEDYSLRWIQASFFRILRMIALFIATSLPAFYIAVISFHVEMVPLDLMMSIGESRERVPIPPFLEALIMEIAVEMLRESGLRLPTPIGQTIGVVGGIIIGEAAVQAGLVSNLMVIVVSLTAISSFIIPDQDMAAAVRLIRFPMMLMANLFGMIGISIGFMVLFVHIISLTSFEAPYGSPYFPLHFQDWRDAGVRFPYRWLNRRPSNLKPKQIVKQKRSPHVGGE